jgi:hypothetical protein
MRVNATTRIIVLLGGSIAGAARADLLGVDIEGTFYRVSTDDGSTEPVGKAGPGFWSLALGPDNRHYASNFIEVHRVSPFTGESEYLHPFSDVFASGSLAAREDGTLISGIIRYGMCYHQGWDVYEDEYVHDVPGPGGEFCASAGHFRADGAFVVARLDDPVLYAVDPDTGELGTVGTLMVGAKGVRDFATDARTGLSYMTVIDDDHNAMLYRVDLFTAEHERIADLSDSGVLGISAITNCLADFNEDGALNILDFVAFQLAWRAGDDAADVNGDGVFDVLDFVAFQGLFFEGCR